MKIRKITTCFIFLYSLTQHVSGCVFDKWELKGFYSPCKHSDKSKERALLKVHPEYCSKQLLKNVKLAAGPFDIENVVTNGTSSWNYYKQGTDWPQDFPQCNGSRQSPIDIISRETSKAVFPKLKYEKYGDTHPNMTIINNGKTVDVLGPWGLTGTDLPLMSGGPLKGTYQLEGAHFHWGYNQSHGSEHIINKSPGILEIHFVHFNTKYPDTSAAIASNDPEALAVVGIIFETSRSTTPQVKPIFTTLKQAVAGEIIFPALFPLDIISYGHFYYTYPGSLTVPYCSEIVQWIVKESHLKISPEDMNILKKFKRNGVPLQGSYREPQPLNGRKVLRCSE